MLKTVVFAPAGPFRQELRAFVKSIPELELIGVASDLTGLRLMATQCTPHLAILAGGSLFASAMDALRQRKQQSPGLFCLVLAENRQEIQQAVAACADGVLLKGFSTQEFLTVLAGMPAVDVIISSD